MFISCRKDVYESSRSILKENISLNEVRDWFTKYNKQIPEGPEPDFINATKTTINGQLIVRVPLNRGEGEMFFSKDDTLEVKFFRRVPVNNKSKIKFTGFYESIDMKNYSYYKVNYIEGIKVSVYKSKSIRETPVVENVIRGLNFPEFTGSWFRALLCWQIYFINSQTNWQHLWVGM